MMFMKNYTIRTSLRTYLILGTFLGILLGVISIYLYTLIITKPNVDLVFFFNILGIAIINILLYQYKIVFNNTEIVLSKSLVRFYKKESILIKNITELKIDIGNHQNKVGLFTLDIIGKKDKVQINIKPLGKKGLILLVNHIYYNQKNIKIDEYITEIVNGRFPFL